MAAGVSQSLSVSTLDWRAALAAGYSWTPLGYFQITSLGTAVSFSGAGVTVPVGSMMVLIEAEAQGIRWRDDGTAPTASVGMPLAAGQEFQYRVADFSKIQFIQQTNGGIINLSFYK